MPIYDHQLRRTRKYLSYELQEDETDYHRLHLVKEYDLAEADWTKVYGVFKSKREAETALRGIADTRTGFATAF